MLNNAAADAACDVYVASISPAPADGGAAIRASMRPLFRAIYAGIVTNAVVVPTALVWPGGNAPLPVTGTGTIT